MFGARKNKDQTNKTNKTTKPTRQGTGHATVSGAELVEVAFGEPLPIDDPDPRTLSIGPGQVLIPLVGAMAAAHLASTEAQSRGEAAVGAAKEEAARCSGSAAEAARKLRSLRAERQGMLAFRQSVIEHLGGRLHQVHFTARKRLLLTVLIVLGEVALNADAAYQEGDPLVMALLSFLGVGAAVAGVGWLGAQLRDALDQHRFGALEVPESCPPSLANRFGAPKGWWPVLAFSGGLVLTTTVLLGLAVAVLRADAGSVAIYGVFTAVTVLGATAVSYCGHDPVADLLEHLDGRLGILDAGMAGPEAAVEAFRAAQARARALRASWSAQAQAQWDAVMATAWLGLTHQPHVVGHLVPGSLVVLTPDEYEEGTWRQELHDLVGQGADEAAGPEEAPAPASASGAAAETTEAPAPSAPVTLEGVDLGTAPVNGSRPDTQVAPSGTEDGGE